MQILLSFLGGAVLAGLMVFFVMRFLNQQSKHEYEAEKKAEIVEWRTKVEQADAHLAEWKIEREQQEAKAQAERERKEAQERAEREQREAQAREERERKEAQERAEREQREAQAREERAKQNQQQLELLKAQFEATSKRLLEERQREFKSQSSESIDAVLKPLREQIRQMGEGMEAGKLSQKALEMTLKEQIHSLLEQTQTTAQSANELALALRGQNKTQGDWGERQLGDLLASFGFVEGREILTQQYIEDQYGRKIKGDDDKKMRTDVILKLDENRVVVIDSKVTLTAYMDYIHATETQDEMAMADAIERNTQAVLNQVTILSDKNYAAYIQKPLETVEYNIMYVPIAGALRLAQANHPNLWHEAMQKKVLIVDEYTLYALLRTIEISWSKIDQAKNSQKIVDAATLVLERVEALLEKFVEAEASVQEASKSLQAGHDLLTDGGKSIVTAANTLRNLGVKPKSKEYQKRLKKTATIHEELGDNTEDLCEVIE